MSPDTVSPPSHVLKSQRVLSCVLCHQRKVRCDRKFPCANCVKSGSQCIPGALTQRRRKRRFAERELLDRLRKYEELLRNHDITFEPLHKDSAREKESTNVESESNDEDSGPMRLDSSTPSTTIKSEGAYEAKNIWHAMSQGFRDLDDESDSSHDDVRETAIRTAWDQSAGDDDDLLFGSRKTNVDLSILHPDPVHIFRLWQTYLDNVNPLLKVTHTPSLQGRIIEAASNVTSIDPNLEALMFSIYCAATNSLVDNCETMFGFSKEHLMKRFQFGCQQSLLNCGFLRSNDRDCLTALFLYLISAQPFTAPQSLSSLLGVAVRIARRMGIHSESALAKCSPAEAEMRRRLWWSLILFDTRISELASAKLATLNPTWDCKAPLNVNDSDLRPEMKEPPTTQGTSTEAIFAFVRGMVGDYIRHTTFYLDLTNPALKPIANLPNGPVPESGEFARLEELIEDQVLQFCDQENPIHFLTVWTTRAQLAKFRLLEHHCASLPGGPLPRTEAQHDAATSHALRVLECDTKVMTSPLTEGLRWLNYFYFPFPAYIQIIQHLRRRPTMDRAGQAWEIVSDNYEAWFEAQFRDGSEKHSIFQLFSKLVLQAWEACAAVSKHSAETSAPPRMISSMRHTLGRIGEHTTDPDTNQQSVLPGMEFDDPPMPMPMPMPMPIPMNLADQNLPFNTGMQDTYTAMGPEISAGIPGQTPFDVYMNQLDWSGLGGWPGWGGY